MEANAYSKYALKDLHQAIDLIDRKITHCRNFEAFETQQARESALRKLSAKRAALVKTALALAVPGVRSDPRFLPRSFIHPVQDVEVQEPEKSLAPEEAEKSERMRTPRTRR